VVSGVAGAFAIALVWLLGPRIFTAFGIDAALAEPSSAVARVLILSVPLHFFYVTSAFFLESIQRPLASTVVMWSANALNLGLNLVLVPRFGALGSAWCTVAARLCLAVALASWVWWLRDGRHFGVRSAASAPSYSALLGVGAAAAVSQAAEAGAFSGMTIIAGRLGADAVSAYQILLNLLAIVFMISLGLSSATAVLAAEASGRGASRDATRASVAGLSVNAALMLLAGATVFGFSDFIGRAYTANPTLAGLVSGLLWLVALVMPPDGSQVVAAAALRARGDNWFPTASHLVAYALVMPALALWFAEAHQQGVKGLLLAILWSSLLSSGVLCARLWLLRNGERAST
jgi:MATE family multidrug resistance protein